MNRPLHFLNLIGVVVLTLVCALQWRRDRLLNLELIQNEKLRLEQQARLTEQEKSLRGVTDDLSLFKDQLARTQSEGGDARKRLRELERENQMLASTRDQLQARVTNWADAVSARDKLIAEANENIRTLNERAGALAGQLNDSILKFNELATNYNIVVEELNAARRAKSAGATNTAAR